MSSRKIRPIGLYGPPPDDDSDEYSDYEDNFEYEHCHSDNGSLAMQGSANATSTVISVACTTGSENKSLKTSKSTKRKEVLTMSHKADTEQVLEDFKRAATANSHTEILRILALGQSVDHVFASGWTGLMTAAHYGNKETVDCLLEAGANPRYHKDMYTCLMAVCSSKIDDDDQLIACAESLVGAGADINILDRQHSSALMYAAREGRAKLVKRLVELGADMNLQDNRGYTAIMWAVAKHKIETVYTLLQLGCDVNKRDRYGSKAVDLAAMDGAKQIEQLLKTKSDANSAKLILTQAEVSNETGRHSGSGDSTQLRYGDLETVLSGVGLFEFIDTFHEHEIDLQQLLRMSDSDLQQVVRQAGPRKKLVDAIDRLNKKEWEKSSISSNAYKKKVSCSDAIFMVRNIKQHVGYITSAIAYIQPHMTEQALRSAQEGAGSEQLTIHVTEASTNVRQLYDELCNLSEHLCVVTSKVESRPPDLVMTSHKAKPASKSWFYRLAISHAVAAGLTGIVIYVCMRQR